MRKIIDFKNSTLKVERILKTLFRDDAENAKNDATILKTYFFGFSLFFAIFWKFYQKGESKLGNNIQYMRIVDYDTMIKLFFFL